MDERSEVLGTLDERMMNKILNTGEMNHCRDLSAALDTLLSLSGRERVKHLVLGHPSLLLMGFELPGQTCCSPWWGWTM